MSYLMIRVEIPGMSVTDLNSVVQNGDSTKPSEALNSLVDLLNGINSRTPPGEVAVAVRETTEAISADGDGVDATFDKL